MKNIITIVLLLFSFSCFAQTDADINSLNSNERFVVTTTDKTLTVGLAATYHHVFTLNNPANSGFVINLSKILFFASGTGAMIPTSATIFVNPTLVTTFASTPINLSIGSTYADATTTVGYNFSTTAISGSGGVPYELPLSNGSNLLSNFFNLRPGNSIGIDLARSLLLGAAVNSGYFMIYYTRTPMPQ